MTKNMIDIKNLSISYGDKKIINDIDFSVREGEFVTILGKSGSGKSTLLNSINLSSEGSVKFDSFYLLSKNIKGLTLKSERELLEKISFIYQSFNVIDRLSVIENVISGKLKAIPFFRYIFKVFSDEEIEKAYSILKEIHLEDEYLKRCDEISGGQKQRVAIARALYQDSNIVLADEPISSLDPTSSKKVMELLRFVSKRNSKCVIISLHQIHIAKKYSDRVVAINGRGKIIFNDSPDRLTSDILEEVYI